MKSFPALLGMTLAACSGQPPSKEQCVALMRDNAIVQRCAGGQYNGRWKEAEDCYPFTSTQRMTGIVVNEFERREFFAGASRMSPAMRRYTYGTWLDFSNKMTEEGVPKALGNGAYRVTFDGRRAACGKPQGSLNGYGHMSEYASLVVVNRVISWEQIKQLPDPFKAR